MTGYRTVWRDESGLGTLEILLIVAVLVLIAVVFRKWIISWVNDLFSSTNQEIREQISSSGGSLLEPGEE